MTFDPGLAAHLATGVTRTCHAWAITRSDGAVFGFTDHDRDLAFDGITFRADTGLSAVALQQTTGLSVDNTEALGALSDTSLREADIEAGRFDGADLSAWIVCWQDVALRQMVFRGTLGEIRRAGGAFRAELRGLSEALNRPLGRVYQKPCTAVLGDASCRVTLDDPAYRADRPAEVVDDGVTFRFSGFDSHDFGWFQHGRLTVLSGVAEGLSGVIKRDRFLDGLREVELWAPLRAAIAPGDLLRFEAGCDRRFETCRLKFGNVLNFQGFPDIPGEDWQMTHPARSGALDGGSRR